MGARPALLAQNRNQAKESEYFRSLETKSPEAAQSFRDATAALDQGQTTLAEEKFRRTLELVPNFSPALRRLSYVVKNPEEALALARKALSIEPHPYNQMAVINALLTLNEPTGHAEALRLATAVSLALIDDEGAHALLCQAALAARNPELFSLGLERLKKRAPDGMLTHFFLGIDAFQRQHKQEARRELLRARDLGYPADIIETILKENESSKPISPFQLGDIPLFVFLGWIVLMVLLFLAGIILSRHTLASLKSPQLQKGGPLPLGIRLTRRVYKLVLNVEGLFFYFSLPIVMVVVLVVGGGILYAMFSATQVSIKLVLIVVTAMFLTIGAIVKSIFIRHSKEDPGRRLEEPACPQLFDLTRRVAEKIGTRPVQAIFLVPGDNIAVFERGSWRQKLSGHGERCLIIGYAALKALNQQELRAVLAHEYGHFSHKDTAGGTFAGQVHLSINAFISGMVVNRTNKWYNPAWLFVNAYYRIFLRIAEGASRLQEVLADRLAAGHYGKDSLIHGLRSISLAGVRFKLLSQMETFLAEKESRPPANFFALEIPAAVPAGFPFAPSGLPTNATPQQWIDHFHDEAINRKTSVYDSHPSFNERSALVEAFASAPEPQGQEAPAAGLLPLGEEEQKSMTLQIFQQLGSYFTDAARRQAVVEARSSSL